MTDTFCIKVQCTRCKTDQIIKTEGGSGEPLLFDDMAAALSFASRLHKKPGGLLGTLDKSIGLEKKGDTPIECPACHAILMMKDLSPIPFRYQSEE